MSESPATTYGTPTHQAAAARERLTILAVLVALFVLGAIVSAIRSDMSLNSDELAQVSYVAQMQTAGGWRGLDDLRMLDPHSFAFTDRPNYLNHPPVYYAVAAHLSPTLEGHPEALLWVRLLNVLMSAIGLGACLAIGCRASSDRAQFYASAIPLVCIPVLVPLAGSVNNDNAAFCGGALALAGLYGLVAGGRRVWLAVALAGVVIAAWAKFTGLLLAGGTAGAVAVYLFVRRRHRRAWMALAAFAAVLAVLPYTIFAMRYGSPVPDTAAQEALLHAESGIFGWADAARLSPLAYAAHFVRQFVVGWMPSFEPQTPLQYAVLLIPLAALAIAAAGVAASVTRLVRRQETPLDVLIAGGTFAFAVTFASHIAFSYQRHLATGWMLDAYPRYYLPIAAIVPLAGLSAAAALRDSRLRTTLLAFLAVSPIVFRLLAVPPF